MKRSKELLTALETAKDYCLHEEEQLLIIDDFLRPTYSESIRNTSLSDDNFYGDHLDRKTIKRLRTLQEDIEDIMSDGNWYTADQLYKILGRSDHGTIKRRIRQAEESGRWKKEMKDLGNGHYAYRLKRIESNLDC